MDKTSPFAAVAEELLSNPDLLEEVTGTYGAQIPVIVSEVTTDEKDTVFGVDEGEDFSFTTLERFEQNDIVIGKKVWYAGREYKIEKITREHAAGTITFYVKSMSSK